MLYFKSLFQTPRLYRLRGAINHFDLHWADGLLLLTVCFWGVNFSLVKFALSEIPPLLFNGLRFLVASTTMLLLLRATRHPLNFQRSHLPYLIALGILGNTAYQLFFIFGLAHTTADNSALILATVPVWVSLAGTLIGIERLTGQGWLGVFLSLSGILLIVLSSNRQLELRFGGATLLGDALILMATLCWSAYTLTIRFASRYYSSMAITSFSTLIGTIPLVMLATPTMLNFDWSQVPTPAWAALALSGIFGIALAYFFWNNGVSHLGSARTSFYSNLVPPIALVVAWLALGETLTFWQLCGGVLAITGVILARGHTYPVTRSSE